MYLGVKMQINKLFNILFLSIFICLIAQNSAMAYIDPGTGSMVMQIIIATIGALGYVVTTSFDKIKGFFKKNDKH